MLAKIPNRAVCLAWALSISVHASAPDITFDCETMPEVCTNMCWAMRCASPTFPQHLTWDNGSLAWDIMAQNRAASGCKMADNRCCAGHKHSKEVGHIGGKYRTCDEYPFYFTLENGLSNGQAVSRCVRTSSGASQTDLLLDLYEPWVVKGYRTRKFRVGIANPGAKGVMYCLNQPCVNDGFELQGGMVKVDGPGGIHGRGEDPSFRFFKTGSGLVMASVEHMAMGAKFTRRADVGDDLESLRGLDHWVEEADGRQTRFVSDVILEEVSPEHFAG
ncbi:hypothetical protein QQS21_003795 [Conoideocrella luteorostrata]|uniref:Deoxyribonuclease NucA/NucB domain-containing protein n=1 Tax=Conoideocrella luteorostrata TaxID=1105319 RepID=A0AAJ0G222_9HYPO|nr:hypothetical protein QQS21_003795 [Conoideocrella luteorostrata]